MGPRVRGDDERWLRRRDTPRGRGRRASVRVLAARMRPSCARRFAREGRGECRVPTHPQPRMQNKKAYELVTTGKPEYPAFPHATVLTVSFVISPVIGLCCHRRFACAKLDASVEASGPHDFAVRVQPRSSAVPNSVHRIPSRVRDDRERPSVGRDSAIRKVFCLQEERKYFCDWCWTGVLPVPAPSAVARSPFRTATSLRAQRSNPAWSDKAGLLRRFAPRKDGRTVTRGNARRATPSRGAFVRSHRRCLAYTTHHHLIALHSRQNAFKPCISEHRSNLP